MRSCLFLFSHVLSSCLWQTFRFRLNLCKPDPIACVYNHVFFSCIIEECCEMKDDASKIFKLLICELSLNLTLFNRCFLFNTHTLIMTNSVTVCKPKLIIVQFSSSRGCYVGDFVVFVIVDNLFGCSVSRYFFSQWCELLSLRETQIYKYTVYVYEMLNKRKKCLFFCIKLLYCWKWWHWTLVLGYGKS